MAASVLLVEDSALVVGALRILLEDRGWRVSSAGTVAQAVDVATAERPDVMLLDIGLPDGDGLTVLERLRAAGFEPRVTVALTGHDDRTTRERCLRAGCREVLVKPMRALALPGQIAAWLADADARSGSGGTPASTPGGTTRES